MIRDKTILIENIYYMLSYAFLPLTPDGYKNLSKEAFTNIHNLFAAILSQGISIQLKQGLYREYIDRRESLTLLRGKIDMQETIHNRLSRKRVIACEFDELSENNLLNQIIKATVMLLIRHNDVKPEYKSALKRYMLYFSGVDMIDPSFIQWHKVRFYRHNATYRMLINICQLILEGMLLTTRDGEYMLASFLRPEYMSRLYEKFILEYYAKEHKEIYTRASYIPWALDDGYNYLLPAMHSDITLKNKSGDKVLIIDAKYYASTLQTHYNSHTIYSEHMYQIFAYVKNMAAKHHNVSGMLLYARTDEALQPCETYHISGNTISVRTLNLNTKFSDIAAQLDDILASYMMIDAPES